MPKRIPKYSPSDNDTNGFSKIFISIFFNIFPILLSSSSFESSPVSEESSKLSKGIFTLKIKLAQTANNADIKVHNKYKKFFYFNKIKLYTN